jgi:hypothetical protein
LTAVSFIETMNSAVLSIDPLEFEQYINEEKFSSTTKTNSPTNKCVLNNLTNNDLSQDDPDLNEWVWIPANSIENISSTCLQITTPAELIDKKQIEDLTKEEIEWIIKDYKRLLAKEKDLLNKCN